MSENPDALPVVDYEFLVPGALTGSPWLVREVDVREALSGEFAARVELENDDAQANPADLLGAPATVRLSRVSDDPVVRTFGGVVRAVDEPWGSDLAGRRRCRVVVEPAFACLKEERLTRKFLGVTVPDVVRAVLAPWAVEHEREFELALAREDESPASGRGFAVRDLCVQYDETTYDFLRRLLAEEGLSYFFVQDEAEGREKLVVVDDNGGFPEAAAPIPLRPAHGGITSREAVRGLGVARGRAAARTEARAYNLTQHSPIVERRARGQGDGGGGDGAGSGGEGGDGAGGGIEQGDGELVLGGREVTLFGYEKGSYTRNDAAVQARLALERSAVAAIAGRGRGDVIAFSPGLVFALEPDGDVPPEAEGRQLLVSVRHRGGNPERLAHGGERALPYENQFTFVPAAIPFRPSLVPKPTAVEDWAIVVSAIQDDPIYTDQHGRVRVRFGYDRESTDAADRCSPWIPVSQAWAGEGFGVQIIPRAGMLVRVRYLHGDPDRPFVVGCLPTGRNVLPSPLPEEKTRLTIRTQSLRKPNPKDERQHWNEISLDDAAEHEQVFIRAGHDYRQEVLHDESVRIDHDEDRSVGRNQSLEVGGHRRKTVHKNETALIKQKRETVIAGDDQRHVKGNDGLTVEKDQLVHVVGARTTTVQGPDVGTYLAGREESVTGNDELHVSRVLTTIADKTWRASQGPTDLVLDDGDVLLKAGGNITLEVKGARLKMEAGGKAVLECKEKISLLCGEASIVISPDKIEIAAPEVNLTGANGAVKLDRAGATTTGLNVSSSAMASNEITGAFVKAN